MAEFTNCDNKNIPFEDLLKSLMTIDQNGDVAIRVINNTDTEVPFYDCDNKNIPLEDAVRKAIISIDGLPTLNLAVITPGP